MDAADRIFVVLATLIPVIALVGFGVLIWRAWHRLSTVERIALWWWITIGALAFGGVFFEVRELFPAAGVLMIGLGTFVAANVGGVATRLGERRIGVGPVWQQMSAGYWRLSGGFLVLIGLFWAFAGFVERAD